MIIYTGLMIEHQQYNWLSINHIGNIFEEHVIKSLDQTFRFLLYINLIITMDNHVITKGFLQVLKIKL